jgi:hypothetical protein
MMLLCLSQKLCHRRDVHAESSSGKPRAYLHGLANERAVAISADGHWLAYVSDESGRDEVYVRSFPAPNGAVQISTGGGREPRWSSNGREVFYRGARGMVATSVRTAPGLEVISREVLFDDREYLSWQDGAAYDTYIPMRGGS